MFEGKSPENYEQKCLCVLVLDVSGSMQGEPIVQLNNGLQQFRQEVLKDFVATQRLEVGIVTFGSTVVQIQEPAHITNFEMPSLISSGLTKLVDGVRLAIDIVERRKQWYRDTGQNYFRPMIILITDGEPDADQDIDGLSAEVAEAIKNNRLRFYAVGVKGYNHQKLSKICSTPPPASLNGLMFTEFFRWLSNSISIITKSTEGQKISLPSTDSWTQITM